MKDFIEKISETKTKLNELKPCPFCQQTDSLSIDYDTDHVWTIECDFCDVKLEGNRDDTRDQVISKWNNRLKTTSIKLSKYKATGFIQFPIETTFINNKQQSICDQAREALKTTAMKATINEIDNAEIIIKDIQDI